MPVDAEAAGKNDQEKKDAPLDLGSLSDTPGQRMKELVNLDTFKNSISNLCQLWLGGIPAQPRRYKHWRSRVVQQEKITFVEPTPTAESTVSTTTITAASVPASNTLVSTQSGSHTSPSTGLKAAGTESVLSNPRQDPMKVNKRKEPVDLLDEMYKHTYDPLPE